MIHYVVSLFDHPDKLNEVMNSLERAGFDRSNIENIKSDPESQNFFKRVFTDEGGEEMKAEQALEYMTGLGIPEDEADDYADEVKKGRSLLLVRCTSDAEVEQARNVINPARRKERTEATDSPRSEIDVQGLSERALPRYQQFEPQFRTHYEEHFADADYEFDEYSRGYRYGMALAEDEDYRGEQWEDVEQEAGRQWESQEASTWDNFREAVRYGWYQIRGKEDEFERRPPR